MSQGLSLEDARLAAGQSGSVPEGRVVCAAKRIRSIYLPLPPGGPLGLPASISPERPGLILHYRWRDYAPLQTCPEGFRG